MGDEFEGISTKERVHYQGQFRLIGLVKRTEGTRKLLGYVIMQEKTKQIQMMTYSQVLMLMSRFTFVNAEIKDNNSIINTECSMTALPEFDVNGNIIGNAGIMVIGRIKDVTGGKAVNKGFRILNTDGKIADVSENELIMLSKRVKLINASVKNSENSSAKPHISAIKKPFTVIEQVSVTEEKKKEDTPGAKWRKQAHLRRLVNTIIPHTLKEGIIDVPDVSEGYYWRDVEGHKVPFGSYYAREMEIIVNEIYLSGSFADFTDTEKKKMEALAHCENSSGNPFIDFFMLCQYALKNKEMQKKVAYKVTRIKWFKAFSYDILHNSSDEIYNKPVVVASIKAKLPRYSRISESEVQWIYKNLTTYTKNYVASLIKKAAEMYEKENSGDALSDAEIARKIQEFAFNTRRFKTEAECEKLGFTLRSTVDSDTTHFGSFVVPYHKYNGESPRLKYACGPVNLIGIDVNKYMRLCTCLGDMIALSYISIILNNLVMIAEHGLDNKEAETIDNDSDMDYYYTPKRYEGAANMLIEKLQMIITLAAINNSNAIAEFMKEKAIVKRYELISRIWDATIPSNIEDVANTDWKLSADAKLYYQSGFNVATNDHRHKYIKKNRFLDKAPITNYRKFGPRTVVYAEEVQTELLALVKVAEAEMGMYLVESDANASTAIGQLRFM